jgi:hypothetical protein
VGTPKCEADHTVHPEVLCSAEVTHLYRVACVGRRKLVCQAAADLVVSVAERSAGCALCFAPVSECWSVVPV